jgi:hypothetical protein
LLFASSVIIPISIPQDTGNSKQIGGKFCAGPLLDNREKSIYNEGVKLFSRGESGLQLETVKREKDTDGDSNAAGKAKRGRDGESLLRVGRR